MSHVSEAIEKCREISNDKIEISAPHYFQPLKKLVRVIKNFQEDGCSFLVHNYFPSPRTPFVLNIASAKNIEKQRARRLVERALAICEQIKSPLYGVHAGYLADAIEGQGGMFKFEDKVNSYKESLNNSIRFIQVSCVSDFVILTLFFLFFFAPPPCLE